MMGENSLVGVQDSSNQLNDTKVALQAAGTVGGNMNEDTLKSRPAE